VKSGFNMIVGFTVRPLKLSLEGFTSFREPTEVDFDGADYFALVGPTVAGKSSLIDAIAFVCTAQCRATTTAASWRRSLAKAGRGESGP